MVSNDKKKRKNKRNKKDKSVEVQLSNEDKRASIDEELEAVDQSIREAENYVPQKREHVEDDSDNEEQPKRKKKKKQQVLPEDGNKKGKKSKRQVKKEKFAQRQAEAQAASKDQLKTECLTYLSQWKHDKQNWKFMKVKQGWLFKNKFSSSLVPDASWPLLLEYFDSAQGNIRKLLLDDANKIIKQLDEWTESQNKGNDEDEETETDISKPDDNVYKRARDLIQCLQE